HRGGHGGGVVFEAGGGPVVGYVVRTVDVVPERQLRGPGRCREGLGDLGVPVGRIRGAEPRRVGTGGRRGAHDRGGTAAGPAGEVTGLKPAVDDRAAATSAG